MDSSYPPTTKNGGNFAKSTDEIYKLGDKISELYEVFGIKKGGFGLVYLVRNVENNQKYAVKTLQTSSLFSRDHLISEIIFLLEAGRHPNIVKVFFVDVFKNTPHLFMEYVAGGTLRDIISTISTLDAIKIAYQICLGMEHINTQKEIVHGDLKPENILVSTESIVKISDFSLSQQLHPESGVYFREESGTLPYMSPEQIKGEVLDTRSDIFSFGILFYEMIEKQLPYPFTTKGLTSTSWRTTLTSFYDGNNSIVDDYRHTFWKDMSNDIPDYLKSIIMPCIFPDPHDRWWSFQELRKYFEAKIPLITDHKLPNNTNEDLHMKALAYYKLGKLEKAIDQFNVALSKNPTNAELWRDAAIVLRELDSNLLANEFLLRARLLNPEISFENQQRLRKDNS